MEESARVATGATFSAMDNVHEAQGGMSWNFERDGDPSPLDRPNDFTFCAGSKLGSVRCRGRRWFQVNSRTDEMLALTLGVATMTRSSDAVALEVIGDDLMILPVFGLFVELGGSEEGTDRDGGGCTINHGRDGSYRLDNEVVDSNIGLGINKLRSIGENRGDGVFNGSKISNFLGDDSDARKKPIKEGKTVRLVAFLKPLKEVRRVENFANLEAHVVEGRRIGWISGGIEGHEGV